MTLSALVLGGIEVLAEQAEARRTPVAFTNVSKAKIQGQLGFARPAAVAECDAVRLLHRAGGRSRRRAHQRARLQPAQHRGDDQRRARQRHGERLGLLVQLGRPGRRRHQHPAAARPQRHQPGHAVDRRDAQRDHRPEPEGVRLQPQAGVRERGLPEDDDDRVNGPGGQVRHDRVGGAQDGRRDRRRGRGPTPGPTTWHRSTSSATGTGWSSMPWARRSGTAREPTS